MGAAEDKHLEIVEVESYKSIRDYLLQLLFGSAGFYRAASSGIASAVMSLPIIRNALWYIADCTVAEVAHKRMRASEPLNAATVGPTISIS